MFTAGMAPFRRATGPRGHADGAVQCGSMIQINGAARLPPKMEHDT